MLDDSDNPKELHQFTQHGETAELLESLLRFQTKLAQGLRDLGDRLTKIEQSPPAGEPMLNQGREVVETRYAPGMGGVVVGNYSNQCRDFGAIPLPNFVPPPLNRAARGRATAMGVAQPRPAPALSERIASLEVEHSVLRAEHFNTAAAHQERLAFLERECLAIDQSGGM